MRKRGQIKNRQRLIRQIDRTFSLFVRWSAADGEGMARCFTCKRRAYWSTLECGHFQSRQFLHGRWMLDNVAVQCRQCNRRSGEQYRFARQLDATRGDGAAVCIERKARRPHPYTMERLEKLKRQWRRELDTLRRNKPMGTHATNTKTRHKLERTKKTGGPQAGRTTL